MLIRGFTLIEMILTLTALALVLQGWYVWKNARLVEAAVTHVPVPLRLRQVYFYLFGTRRSYPACLLDDLAAGPIDASDLGRPPKAFRSDRYARSGANAPAGGNYCDCRRAARPIAAISDQRERGQRVLL